MTTLRLLICQPMAVGHCKTEEAQAASLWQMLADKWNDQSFAPVTASEPDWHPHFASSKTITYEMVSEFLPQMQKR